MAKRKYHRKIYKRSKKRKIFFFLLFSFLSLIFLIIFSSAFLFVYYAKDLPRPEKFTEREFAEPTKIYDRTGETLLYELYGEEKREIIPLSEMPECLKKAIIFTEDSNFYSHIGIDFQGIIRAIKINLRIGRPLYGGSTISQQLIRSTFLTREKTIKRKVREIILTLELERRYSKDEILEWYLNQIPFGPNIYGVEVASKTYFEKSAKDLTIPEAATLAAMVQAPSYYFPYGEHKEDLLQRKDYVLERLGEEHYITKKEAENFKKEKLEFAEISQSIKAPHFVFHVQDYLLKNYGQEFLQTEGLKVYTTLDWELQQTAQKVIKEGTERNKNFGAYNGALVATEPKTGEILAMVGSADWFGDSYPEDCTPGKDCIFDPKVNTATYQNGRQPGSAFKPFVYATAFEKGYDDNYIVIDEKTDFGVYGGKHYIPHNYDMRFRGSITLREALAQSINVPSVKVLKNLAGQEDSIETAKKMGITTLDKPPSFYGLSIVLGGGEVRLLDMVSAYGVFAREGLRIPPTAILKIEDSNGNIIEKNNKTPRRVLSAHSARLINDILSDNEARAPMFGRRSPLYLENYDTAAKTGTTDDFRDAWTIGYSPSIVVGVWVGNNDNTSMARQPAVVLAGPIWHNLMNYILPKLPKENFTPLKD